MKAKKYITLFILTLYIAITAFVQLQNGRAGEGPARHAPPQAEMMD